MFSSWSLEKKSDVVWVTKCTEYKQNEGKCKRAQYQVPLCGATLIQTMLFLAMWDMNLLTVLNFLLYLENVVVWGKINNISDFKTSLWRLPDESRVKAHFVFSQDPVIENTWTVNYQQLLLCNTLRLTKLWGFRSDSTSRHNILSV